MTETKLSLFTTFNQNFNFFTDQNMIEAITQNCAKTKGAKIKMNNADFEVHGRRFNLHLLTLI